MYLGRFLEIIKAALWVMRAWGPWALFKGVEAFLRGLRSPFEGLLGPQEYYDGPKELLILHTNINMA